MRSLGYGGGAAALCALLISCGSDAESRASRPDAPIGSEEGGDRTAADQPGATGADAGPRPDTARGEDVGAEDVGGEDLVQATDGPDAGASPGSQQMAADTAKVAQVDGAQALRLTRDEMCVLDGMGRLHCGGPFTFHLEREGPFVDYFIGSTHNCGLTPDGRLVCWSRKTSEEETILPECDHQECVQGGGPPPAEARFKDIAHGDGVVCGVTRGGQLPCWGLAHKDLATPPAGDDFVSIVSDGDDTMCALRETGEAVCWGRDVRANDETPKDVVQIALADHTQVFLHADGTISANGWALPATYRPDRPVTRVSLERDAKALCGLDRDGGAHCYGADYLERETPAQGPFTELANSDRLACGLDADGRLACWGTFIKGPGPEQCRVGSAQLERDAGTESFFVSNSPFSDVLGGASEWGFGTPFGHGYAALYGDAPLPGSETLGLRSRLLGDATVAVAESYWSVVDSVYDPAQVYCTPRASDSTVTRHADELLFRLDRVADLGACPGAGTPVSGSVTFCTGRECPDHQIRGQVGDVDLSGLETSERQSGSRYTWSDGSHLQPRELWTDAGDNPGLMLFPSRSNPLFGSLLCVAVARSTPMDPNGNLRASMVELSGLSLLGPCPDTGGGSWEMCLR
ncbi:MAG: hypothetical protein OXR73_31570 [Myxococcales bacterium]|nr:hypothetical protein [Myxococcales bacterium]